MMPLAEALAVVAAGVFFLTGLLTGIWKFLQMRRHANGLAHPYVDTAHRSALLYSFAAILLAYFARVAELPPAVATAAVLIQVIFFGGAIASYILHGWLQDTDNQMAKPSVLGRRTLPNWVVPSAMITLIVAEVGGFLVLFWGVLRAVF